MLSSLSKKSDFFVVTILPLSQNKLRGTVAFTKTKTRSRGTFCMHLLLTVSSTSLRYSLSLVLHRTVVLDLTLSSPCFW